MITRYPTQTSVPILEILEGRWSPRTFSDQPIEVDTLRSLFEAARWTASSSNLQPWSFIIADKHENPDGYQKILANLKQGNQRWAQSAPVLGIALTNRLRKPDVENRHAFYDVGAAMAQLTIQATAHEIYVRQMGGIHIDKIKDEYNLLRHYEPVVGFALGYLSDVALPGERQRKPLADVVFDGELGRSYFE